MILELPWPPTANHLHTVVRGRKILSTRAREYYQRVRFLVRAQNPYHQALRGRLRVTLRASPPDRRKRDLGNIEKAVCDSLEKAGVYENDSQIDDLRIIRLQPSKPAYVSVEIQEMPAE
jgi:crossover junction endodeoxyribonuclease RusA